ncbi:NAD(P)H-dependent oxidoreductase [Pseudomonas aeruginosa]|nr:NAD(P)H-dependent oxidoreductase [Pseudomonas aeruginosa]
MRRGKAGVRPPRCSRRKASAHLTDLALEELDEVARPVEADAIVFGSPTYMGGPAWQFKKFADATLKALVRPTGFADASRWLWGVDIPADAGMFAHFQATRYGL